MKVAVVGSTGMVGRVMIQLLEERKFPISTLLPVASENSKGKKVVYNGQEVSIIDIDTALQESPDLAIFSAGSELSLEYAPLFAAKGTIVIDNSSAWRMNPDVKLIVPEINAHLLRREDKIIANPNCSTIQMVMVLNPIHRKYGVKRVVVSTYQSISGTGSKAVLQMENERKGLSGEMAYPYPIDKNCLPHCDVFLENDYTKEEMKLTNETVKIMQDKSIKVTATAVRVPVIGGHSEALNVELNNAFDLQDIRKLLSQTQGVTLKDNPLTNTYPMPLFAHQKDEVFVGRLRRDETQENTLNMWVVADNLRKGAATNAIQIAEYLNGQGLL